MGTTYVYGESIERIATALERIAKVLEKNFNEADD